MKCVLTILILAWTELVPAQSVTLAWNPSPSAGVCEYRLYFGTTSRAYPFVTNCGLKLKQTVALPHTGRWFFAATVTDTNGVESDFSNEVQWEARPAPPVLHGEAWVRLTPVIECSTNLVDWRSVAGVPTWFRATNQMEFFTTHRLLIERVVLMDGK